MAIKNPDLYSAFWARCDELRGGTQASEETDYALVIQQINGWRRSIHGNK